MTTVSSFQKKLAGYSALSGAFMATALAADAQILYTDVMPDDTLTTSEERTLDLNNDGVVDFYLTQAHQIFDYRNGEVLGNNLASSINSVVGIATSTSMGTSAFSMKLPFLLQQYQPISSNLAWAKPKKGSDVGFNNGYEDALLNALFWTSTFYGFWKNGVEDGYLGLRINVNGDSYYGWARLDVDSAANWMVLKDYAINLTPNTAIGAGQCFCPPTGGITESITTGNIIFPNPASTKIFISGLAENFDGAYVSILDLWGRKQFAQRVSSAQNEIDVSSLNNGIYFLELKTRNQTQVEKFEVSR